jgi:hypothetical protein
MTGEDETGSSNRHPRMDGAPGPAIAAATATDATKPLKRRRRRRRRRGRKDQIDIAAVLLAPVKLLQGARSKQITAYEATLRAQVTRAIEGKDSASIKTLIELAVQYDLIAPPPSQPAYSGVFVVPKALCDADQKEIFGNQDITMGQIAKIILRHYDQQK